jgi:Fe-S oxidoreductase
VLVGCAYLRGAPPEARSAAEVAAHLAGRPVAVATVCCGLPLRLAGDRGAFERHAAGVARSLAGYERVFVADAGCAYTLARRYPGEARAALAGRIVPLVEAAARALARSGTPTTPPDDAPGPVRWHDPCALGRGLGLYDAPRAVLAHALGRAPDEFTEARDEADCSGGGGLLPSTMPAVAARIAASRIDAHRREGGGRIVTGCASSLFALRRQARSAGMQVDDLVTWTARALARRSPGRL